MSEGWVSLSDDDEEKDWSDQELEYDMWEGSFNLFANNDNFDSFAERSDISVWTPQGKLPISCSKAYSTLTPDYDDNVEDIVADLSDIKSDIKNISKILLQDLVRYNPSSGSYNIPSISAEKHAIYKNQRLRNRTKAFEPQLSLPLGIGIRRGSNISNCSDKESLMSPRDVVARNLVNNDQKYTLSWYPTGGSIERIPSLIEEKQDQSKKFSNVHQLQEQVSHLADSQATTDERYSKVKQENASLNQKILMLEEHIRELELRSEERLQTEQKRNKDSIQRLEREKQLEIENYSIKNQSLERDLSRAQQEIVQLKSVIERLRLDKAELDEQLNEAHAALASNEVEIRKLEEAANLEFERSKTETARNAHIVEELEKEVESLRDQLRGKNTSGRRQAYASSLQGENLNGELTRLNSTDSAFSVSTEDRIGTRVVELESEIKSLKASNQKLTEANEEMQAQILNRGLEEGKAVLYNHDTAKANLESMSIARELEGLSDSQVRQALKEQQDVNEGLRGYIDGILMNIMEKYPELLEVRK